MICIAILPVSPVETAAGYARAGLSADTLGSPPDLRPMAGQPRTVSAALEDSPAAGLLLRLEASRAALETLRPIVEEIAPGVDLDSPAAGELRDGVLHLAASSAALATKLRQASPRLLGRLHQSGAQVSEIRFRIQPGPSTYPDPAQNPSPPQRAVADPASWIENASAALDCAARLRHALPDSPLRRAVMRLEQSLRERLGG